MAQSVEDSLVVRMEASLAKFERQMAKGQAVANSTATGIERKFANTNRKIQQSSNSAAAGIGKMVNVSRGGRFVIQNTANQIGDMAVQMEMGTAASRIMSQQLPQLFGGFAALGGTLGLLGPIIGTVAALGVPLATAFLISGDEAESFEDKLKGLEKALGDLKTAQSLAGASAGDLLDDYGGLADEAKAIFEINREIAALKAQSALDDTSRGIADALGIEGAFDFAPELIANIEETVDAMRAERDRLQSDTYNMTDEEFRAANDRISELKDNISSLGDVSSNLDDLGDMLGIAEEEARQVAVRFAEIGQADNARERADAMSELASYIKEVSGNLIEAEDEGKLFYEQLVNATLQALEFAKTDLSKPITEAANEAGRLAENLAKARGAQYDAITGGNPDFFDTRGEFGSSNAGRILRDRGVPRENRPGYTPPKTRKSGGGGGSSSNKGMLEAANLLKSTRTEAEKYAVELERINELHRLFPEIVTTEVKDRAMAALDESVSKTKNLADTLENSLADVFASVVSGSQSASDAVKGLLQQFAQLLAKQAILGLFDGVEGGGSLLSGILTSSASGTNYSNGGLTRVGENGTELVNLPRGSQVYNARQTRDMMSGGGSLHVTVGVEQNGNLTAFVQDQAGRVVAQSAPTIMAMQDRKFGQQVSNHAGRKG